MIPDEVVERVREATDIVEVIGEHVRLRKMGSDFRGPCPFHQGKNPNFAVSAREGFYYCYKCGASGDVFSFLRERLGLSFADSVRQMGHRYGVPVPEVDSRGARERDDREPLWEAMSAAAEYMGRLLWQDAAGEQARSYLASREVTREAADSFGLGFAPRDGELLRNHLRALGFDDERQLEVGLLVARDDAPARPRFRNRLIFPIADLASHVVGFGGRLLGPGEPKYLNSPETRIFVKGRLLYNLHRAKQAMRRDDRVLLTEGYFDVMRLATSGVESVVASLGTALTEQQAALLARYTRNAFLLYDSDDAGLKATFRSGLELLRQGMSVRVVTLPQGDDPDTFVARQGAERLERQLTAAMDLFERQVQLLERHGWFADLHRKRRAVDKLLPTIRATADPMTRDIYLGRLAELTGVEREVLQREAEADRGPRGRTEQRGEGGDDGRSATVSQQPPPAHARPGWRVRRTGGRGGWRDGRGRGWGREEVLELVDPSRPRPGEHPTRGAERALVLVMLHHEGYMASIAEEVHPERFHDPVYAEIFARLVDEGERVDRESLVAGLSMEAVAEVEALWAAGEEVATPGAITNDSLAKLRYFELSDQIEGVRRDLEMATTEDGRAALKAEYERLVAARRALGPRGNWARTLGK